MSKMWMTWTYNPEITVNYQISHPIRGALFIHADSHKDVGPQPQSYQCVAQPFRGQQLAASEQVGICLGYIIFTSHTCVSLTKYTRAHTHARIQSVWQKRTTSHVWFVNWNRNTENDETRIVSLRVSIRLALSVPMIVATGADVVFFRRILLIFGLVWVTVILVGHHRHSQRRLRPRFRQTTFFFVFVDIVSFIFKFRYWPYLCRAH